MAQKKAAVISKALGKVAIKQKEEPISKIKTKEEKTLREKEKEKPILEEHEERIFKHNLNEDSSLEEIDEILSLADAQLIALVKPMRRKRGRPSRESKVVEEERKKLVDLITYLKLLRKKIEKKKSLSDTLPGTSLAGWLLSDKDKLKEINDAKAKKDAKEAKDKQVKQKLPLHLTISKEEQYSTAPSWKPREWVTTFGERLVIKGSSLNKEDAARQEELAMGQEELPVSSEEVDEIIRKIKDIYKKKAPSKKAGIAE